MRSECYFALLAFRDQFARYSHGQIDKMKKDYDINSLMHYSSTAFGKNGKTTIVSLDPQKTIGEAETYTELDIIEINALYDCKTSSTCECLCCFIPFSHWLKSITCVLRSNPQPLS